MKSEYKDITAMQDSIEAILGILKGKIALKESITYEEYVRYNKRLNALDKFYDELDCHIQNMATALDAVKLAEEQL